VVVDDHPGRPRHDSRLHDALGDHEHRRDGDHARVAQPAGELIHGRDPDDPGEDQRDEQGDEGSTTPEAIATSAATTRTAAT
jgi:hypothetical protein